jgi:DNA-binding transcriptional ArsR family regulator
MTSFEALADPNRRKILDLLREGEMPAGAFSAELSISQPGISKHLRLLREANLVSVRTEGQKRLYRLKDEGLADVAAWLAPYRRIWADRLARLEDHLEREQ